MIKESFRRTIIRRAMKDSKLTFADRLREAVRTGKPVAHVGVQREGKQYIAVKQ